MLQFFKSLLGRQDEQVCPPHCARSARLLCREMAEFHDAAGNTWSCTIQDMSATGFSIVTGAPLSVGDKVSFIRPSLSAKVIRISGTRVGLRIEP